MIPVQALIDGFDRNARLLALYTDGIAHSASLVQPEFDANCLNWTVGHLVEYRNVIMRLLDLPGVGTARQLDRYRRESEPIRGAGPGVVSLEILLALLEAGQGQIDAGLQAMPSAAWAADTVIADRTITVAERLLFLYFHDTIHTGQVELLAALSRA